VRTLKEKFDQHQGQLCGAPSLSLGKHERVSDPISSTKVKVKTTEKKKLPQESGKSDTGWLAGAIAHLLFVWVLMKQSNNQEVTFLFQEVEEGGICTSPPAV